MFLKRPRLFLSIFLIFALVLVALKIANFLFISNLLKNLPQNPAYVYVSTLEKKPWVTILTEPAQIISSDEISVMSKTHGFVQKVNVETGQVVSKDDLLVTLENKEQFYSLEKGKAARKLAQSTYNRAKDLYAQNMISKEQYEESLAALNQAKADVNYLETLVENSLIKAPFSGRVDYVDLSPGQFVQAGVSLFKLTSLPPYQVEFTLPQQYFQYVAKDYPCQANIGGTEYLASIVKIGQVADMATKRFKVSAQLKTHHQGLITGGSARVQLAVNKNKSESFITELDAIDFTPLGATLWTYDKNDEGDFIAKSLVVNIAEQHNGQCVIESELLTEAMPIITSGFQKLRQGGIISIVTPEDSTQ